MYCIKILFLIFFQFTLPIFVHYINGLDVWFSKSWFNGPVKDGYTKVVLYTPILIPLLPERKFPDYLPDEYFI